MNLFQNTSVTFYMILAIRFLVCAFFCNWLMSLFDCSKKPILIMLAFGLLMTVGTSALTIYITNEPLKYLCFMVLAAALIALFMRPGVYGTLTGALFFALQYMISRAIALGGLSVYTNRNMYQLLQEVSYVNTAELITWVLLLVMILIYMMAMDSKWFSSIHHSETQMFYLTSVSGVLCLYMLFQCYNYYYNMEMVWFSISQIVTACLVQGMQFITIHYAQQVSQMSMQKEKKADGRGQSAMYRLVHDLRTEGAEKIDMPASFSSQPELDAVLMECYASCRVSSIAFDAEADLPAEADKTKLHSISAILAEMLDCALTMSRRTERSAYIKTAFTYKEGWLLMSTESGYMGMLKARKGRYDLFSKVYQLADDLKGSCEVKTDPANHICRCTVRLYCGK